MQIQCAYCKNWIEDTVDKCPYCGAANANLKRYADTTPKTIAELQQWYTDRNLPPEETTRFFIGRNFKAPKAFGIYQEGKNFIVYKTRLTARARCATKARMRLMRSMSCI